MFLNFLFLDSKNLTINGINNLSSEDRSGFEFTANYNVSRKVRFSGSFNFYQFETKGDYTYSYGLQVSYQLNRKYSVQTGLHFQEIS